MSVVNIKIERPAMTRAVISATVIAVSIYEVFYGQNQQIDTVAAIILAISLFAVRKHYRTTYGIIEIAFGVFVLWLT